MNPTLPLFDSATALEPIPMIDGSLLLMTGKTQACWQHAVPKERAAHGKRINLTFRTILQPKTWSGS